MLLSLDSAVSGLQNSQDQMDVIGNNIANVNTVGYKSTRSDLAESFSETLSAASGSVSSQIGMGVTTVSIQDNYTQGVTNTTGIPSDMAISGNGFFVVRDPTSNSNYVTRAGDFSVDGTGYLITPTGQRVQGLNNAGLTTSGDIQINTTGMPATSSPTATMTSFSVDQSGNITVQLSDGTSFVRGQVQLQNFSDPQALTNSGNNLYTATTAAGASTLGAPGANGTGSIRGGSLELSNVDLASEMANLITVQRAFEANAKIVTTSDQMLQTLVQMKQ